MVLFSNWSIPSPEFRVADAQAVKSKPRALLQQLHHCLNARPVSNRVQTVIPQHCHLRLPTASGGHRRDAKLRNGMPGLTLQWKPNGPYLPIREFQPTPPSPPKGEPIIAF